MEFVQRNNHCTMISDKAVHATLNSFGLAYEGKDRFVVRKEIAKALDASGALIKQEPYNHNVGTSERTKAVIEPRLSDQWFLKMEDLAHQIHLTTTTHHHPLEILCQKVYQSSQLCFPCFSCCVSISFFSLSNAKNVRQVVRCNPVTSSNFVRLPPAQ